MTGAPIAPDAALAACLPPELRGPATTIVPVAAGLSGAGVHRVEADGRAYVLKVAAADAPSDAWLRGLGVLRSASAAGLAPRVVHVDEARRAVVSEFVADRGFPRFLRDPATHDEALGMLGRMVRRVHALPVPPGEPPVDGRVLLAATWRSLEGFRLPAFLRALIGEMLHDAPPPADRAPVLSHNDLNPSNLVFDGARLLLLDWDTAWVNDPLYDLAVLSLFFRFDDATSRRLVAAYDDAPEAALPERFRWNRRLAGTLAGAVAADMARRRGHPGAAPDESLDTVLPLADFYQRLMAGAVRLGTPEGQWTFGMALAREAATG